MSTPLVRKVLIFAATILAGFLIFRYAAPLLMPFFLGFLIALGAEPAVRFGIKHLKFPRPLSSAIVVTLTLILLGTTLWLLGGLAVRELGQLAGALPNIAETIGQGLNVLQDWLISFAERAPEGLRPLLGGLVLELFGSGNAFLSRFTQSLPDLFGSLLGWIPDGAISFITGILSAFMISARLPRLKEFFAKKFPQNWKEKYLPVLSKLRKTLGAWLKAQLKLMGITYVIVAAGLLLLRVSFAPLWALFVAFVDAIPVLGTGTVLIPWAVIALLQQDFLLGAGLLITYTAAMLTRTVLEPRLLGKHLGLDPLVTLIFFYAGYKLFGVLGMLLAPMLAAAAKSLTSN